MIKITRSLEELKKELNQLGPRRKHIKRGRTVMKIIKPNEAPEFQSQFNAICLETEELKARFHRMRENHKYDNLLTNVALVAVSVTYVLFTIAVITVLMSH